MLTQLRGSQGLMATTLTSWWGRGRRPFAPATSIGLLHLQPSLLLALALVLVRPQLRSVQLLLALLHALARHLLACRHQDGAAVPQQAH